MNEDSSALKALRRLNAAMSVAALTGLTSLVIEHGFVASSPLLDYLRIIDLACVMVFAGAQAGKLLVVSRPLDYIRTHRLDFSMLFVLGVQTLVHLALRDTPEFRYLQHRGVPSPVWAFYIGTLQVYLLGIVVRRSTMVHRLLVRLRLRPAQMLVLSFLIMIAAGSVFLMLPGASNPGLSTAFVDALFTATSAVCVTGLVVVDTGTHFSAVGHTVLLLLIQAGGLGMLTITASFALFGGEGLSREEAAAMARAHEQDSVTDMRKAFGRMLITTFVLEALGALALYRVWAADLPDPVRRAAWAAFHSVSAFCNAGFSLFAQGASLTGYVASVPTNAIIAGLIVLGGLGFGVLSELGARSVARARGLELPRMSRHARWVLATTGFLLLAGTVLFYLCERSDLLAALPGGDRWLASLFQSVTLRTAGFNTVDVGAFGMAAVVLSIVWMLIGGSPGGTAGGMKTTATAVALSAMTGRPRVDYRTRRRALRIFGGFLAAYAVSCLLLGLAQSAWDRRVMFEAASALGTVGLSMNYTTDLTVAGKLVVCLAMFVGRVGPFAVAASLIRTDEKEEGPGRRNRIIVA